MNINFQGLVDLHTLPTTEPLLPLYEAVVNSIQSINQANITNGNIYIEIEREDSLSLIERENWETDIQFQHIGKAHTLTPFHSFSLFTINYNIKYCEFPYCFPKCQ